MDSVEIGKKIRQLRKGKGLTLQDMSDLFSMGKLSNIENGNTPVNIDDIQLICDRLEFPLTAIIDPAYEERINELVLMIRRAEVSITLSAERSAREMLCDIIRFSKKHHLEPMYPQVDFICGEYYENTNQLSKASARFNKVVNSNTTDPIKIRAFNALACIEHKKGNISTATSYIREALNLIHIENIEALDEKAITYFNAAIFSIHVSSLSVGVGYAHSALEISDGNFHQIIRFLIAILQMFKGETEAAAQNFRECMDYFVREKDILNLMRVIHCLLNTYKMNPDIFPEREVSLQRVLTDDILNINVEPAGLPLKVELIQKLVENAIGDYEYDFAAKLLTLCHEIEREIATDRIHYRSYQLDALLIRKTTGNKQQEASLLEKSLFFLPNTPSLERAQVMYELATLQESAVSGFQAAAATYYEYHQRDKFNQEHFLYVIPAPRY